MDLRGYKLKAVGGILSPVRVGFNGVVIFSAKLMTLLRLHRLCAVQCQEKGVGLSLEPYVTTDGRSASLPSGAYDQILYYCQTVTRQLQ